MAWSLENELRDLIGVNEIGEAMERLGFSRRASITSLRSGWRRGGAETYVYEFDLVEGAREAPMILKACTPGFGVASVRSSFQKWLQRRRSVSERGIATPHLYAVGDCVLLEERLPTKLTAAKGTGLASDLALSAASMVVDLVDMGYRPVDLISDLWCRGAVAVLVDFGEDLGDPATAVPPTKSLQASYSCLKSLGVSGDSQALRLISSRIADFVQECFVGDAKWSESTKNSN